MDCLVAWVKQYVVEEETPFSNAVTIAVDINMHTPAMLSTESFATMDNVKNVLVLLVIADVEAKKDKCVPSKMASVDGTDSSIVRGHGCVEKTGEVKRAANNITPKEHALPPCSQRESTLEPLYFRPHFILVFIFTLWNSSRTLVDSLSGFLYLRSRVSLPFADPKAFSLSTLD